MELAETEPSLDIDKGDLKNGTSRIEKSRCLSEQFVSP